MIQTNELRLGNWVLESKTSKFPMQVVSLGKDYVYLDFEGNEGDVWEPCIKEIAGIPITEDLLVKCGFILSDIEEDENWRTYKLNEFKVNQDHGTGVFWLYSNNKLVISYLHQFQNIYFALTRVELKFKS